jgi:RNase P subunit RPR2
MKMMIKKTYCPVDKRLVKGQEQRVNDSIKIVCPRCGTVLWTKEGWSWRYTKAEAVK